MDGRFNNPFIREEEEAEFLQENCTSSPTLSSSPPPPFSNSNNHILVNDHHHHRNHHHIDYPKHHQKALSVNMASPKKSRRAIQKRVVSIPIGEIDGSTRTNNSKGEGAPPSDSWAWRKYGQKPIKGSPYPRGYYRCSSSKGCPARKQVERSRVDPTMLVITYACEHNHPWPASRNNNSSSNTSSPPPTKPITTRAKSTNTATRTTGAVAEGDGVDIDTKPEIKKEELVVFEKQQELIEDKFNDLGGEEHSMIINSTTDNDFGWFTDDVASTSHAILESPICAGISSSNLNNISGGESGFSHDEMAMIFPMREEDESLFGDLGELPECSVVFRRSGFFEQEEERRRCSLRTAPWCGSTG